jgi:cysteine dioxygenase
MTWLSGQFTAIHDHRGSVCGVRVLTGTVTEIRYNHGPNSYLYPVGSSALHAGELSVAIDDDIHQVGNMEKDSGLVTLHLYTPPMSKGMKYYDTSDTWINGYDQLIASSIKTAVRSDPPQSAL